MPLTLNFTSTQLNGAGSLIGSPLQNNLPQSPYLFTIYHPNFNNGSAYFNIGAVPNSNGNFSGSFTGGFNSGSFGLTGSLSGSTPSSYSSSGGFASGSSGINFNGFVGGSPYVTSMVISQITSSFQFSPHPLTIPTNTLRVSGTGGIYLVIESQDA
tara:strand:+ start:49 stop:516 length:468 start_codon:yes stop_codon:yes gene_type:complete